MHAAEVEHHALALADRLHPGAIGRVVPEPRDRASETTADPRELVLDLLLRARASSRRARPGKRWRPSLASAIPHAFVMQLQLERRLDPAQPRRRVSRTSTTRAPGSASWSRASFARRRACRRAIVPTRPSRPQLCRNAASPSSSSFTTTSSPGSVAAEMECHEHPRQGEQRAPRTGARRAPVTQLWA